MTDGSDKRLAPRRKALLGGRIFTDEGRAWDCRIRDISESGAKVRCEGGPEKGLMVDLKVTKFEDIRRAEVMWVRDGEIGLRFINKMETVPKSMQRFFTLVNESDKT